MARRGVSVLAASARSTAASWRARGKTTAISRASDLQIHRDVPLSRWNIWTVAGLVAATVRQEAAELLAAPAPRRRPARAASQRSAPGRCAATTAVRSASCCACSARSWLPACVA